MAGLLQTIRVR